MKRTPKELKRISRDILNNRYNIPMGAFLTASLIPAVIEIPFSMSAGDYPTTVQTIILLFAECLIMLIGQVLGFGVVQTHLNLTRSNACKISDIFFPFKSYADRFFGISFLLSLLSILCMFPLILGSLYFHFTDTTPSSILILILSGIVSIFFSILLTLNYSLAPFLLLDHPQTTLVSSLHKSRSMMKGNKKRLFAILSSFIGWSILIVCSFGIASLWVSPYITQVMVTFYLDCTGELNQIPVRNYKQDTTGYHNPVY